MLMRFQLPPWLFISLIVVLIISVALLKEFYPKWFIRTPLPVAKVSIGEDACHRALRELYPQHVFLKKRPAWLKNPETGKRMELDFFNEQLSLAVEYNGRQHYEFTPYFHGTIDNFHKQLQRDKDKVNLCSAEGITLITVPHTIPTAEIKNFIRSEIVRIFT